MKLAKKLLALLLSLITISSTLCMATTAQAASSAAFDKITASKPMKTYILSTSNIPCYTSTSLKTRGTATAGKSSTAYIAPTDDVYVVDVDDSLKWAKVTYPVGSKRYTAYIALSKLTSNNSTHKKTTATGKCNTYKRANSSTGASTMYVAKGDTVYLVATSGSYYQIMYNCSGGWRLAWVTKTNYNKYCGGGGSTSSTTSAKFQYPMKSYHKNYTQWAVYPSYRKNSSRKYHVGVDFMSNSDKNIYAVTAGTVKKTGTNSANGKYVIIQHTISGKTVYSFYAHLNSVSVTTGAKVSAGTKIGVVGKTGDSSGGTVHLHFAFVDKYWSSGGYYGYISKKFTGDKVYDSESNMTYYNPYYVIKNGKLPS